ncbi:MAG: ligase-associated DNA damage response endonuclease PdeM [Alphaproteobacteria bacterium]|nr:ligase-associated DNA damage response endonuclease PdeM [Alphaproteobacteria bacterium]
MRPHQDSLFHIGHLAIQMDRSGALYLPQHKIMIVADLHFEKATTLHEKRGSALPPFDSRDTLIRLQNIIKKYQPDQFICLGDTWHDSRGPSRMQREDRDILRNIITNCQTNFIIGNHDESILEVDGLSFYSEIIIDGVVFRHEPVENENLPQICGHLHPVAKVKLKGRVIRRRCFYLSKMQCVLPAMGALSGGLNCLDSIYKGFMSTEDRRVVILGRDRLYNLGVKSLLAD